MWATPTPPGDPARGFLRSCRLDDAYAVDQRAQGDMNIVGPRPDARKLSLSCGNRSQLSAPAAGAPRITGHAPVHLQYDTRSTMCAQGLARPGVHRPPQHLAGPQDHVQDDSGDALPEGRMVAPAVPAPSPLIALFARPTPRRLAPVIIAAAAFGLLFADPARTLVRDWWTNPDAGHGLLLFPVSLWLAWKSGLVAGHRANPAMGSFLIGAAVVLRYLSGLAAELFTIAVLDVAGGRRAGGLRVRLASGASLVAPRSPSCSCAIPLPPRSLNSLRSTPVRASKMWTGADRVARHSGRTNGNVISIPRTDALHPEACSGLRSAPRADLARRQDRRMWLRTVPGRVALIALTIPIAIVVNSVRIFLTAFLMYFVDPALGRGFMHTSEGWALFVVAFGLIGGVGALILLGENRVLRWRARHA